MKFYEIICFSQIENHLYLQQKQLTDVCRQLNVTVTCYSPLGSGSSVVQSLPPPIHHPVVRRISEKYKKSPAQILLRYSIQRGLAVIPSSSNSRRIKENIDIFNFNLTPDEEKMLRNVDQGGRYRKFDFLFWTG